MVSSAPFRFGEFELDSSRFELRRNGRVVRLERIPMELLILLAEKGGGMVSRLEISDRLWGKDVFVDTEHGVNTAISKIRSALHESADHPRFVRTVTGKGYRFVAEPNSHAKRVEAAPPHVIPPEPEAALPASISLARASARRIVGVVAAAIFLAAAALVALDAGGIRDRTFLRNQGGPIHSIAVLPLTNLSGDPSQDYFADGMTDELITQIARFTRVRVISHSSVQHYKGTQEPLAEIARELSVDAVVEGSVMRSGNRVHISTRLIDARSDRNLWAESYDGDVQDVLSLQQDAAGRVAAEVGIHFSASDRAALQNKRAVNPQAHEAYLRGLFYWNQFSCDSFEKSLAYFQQSQAEDPTFPPVYVGIAQAYGTLYSFDCLPQEETLPKSRAAAAKALELDPASGAAHIYLAKYALNYEFDWAEADAEFRQGLALDPNNAPSRAGYARFLLARGRRQEAFTEMKEALELDPTSLPTNVSAAYFYYLARDYDRAIELGRKTIELYPGSSAAYLWLAFAYEAEGRQEEAITAHLKAESLWGTSPEVLAELRRAHGKAGMRGYWLTELATEKSRGGDKAPSKICWMAEIYAQLGDNRQSLAYLDRALQHPCNELPFLGIDPLFDRLHGDAGFRQILAQLHL